MNEQIKDYIKRGIELAYPMFDYSEEKFQKWRDTFAENIMLNNENGNVLFNALKLAVHDVG